MNILLVGCEFAGKTTLSHEIALWSGRNLGVINHFHDHFTVPSSELSGQAKEDYKSVHPQIKEMFQRFMINYHTSPDFYDKPDHHLMGLHIEEAVYAPLYYGYGGKHSGSPFRSPEGQRTSMARRIDETILERAPETVLVLMKASPDVIRQRLKADIRPDAETIKSRRIEVSAPYGDPTRGVVQEEDVELVLDRFEEEFEASLLKKKMVLDTTASTVDETLEEFVEKVQPFLTESDRQRMRVRRGG